MRCPVSKTTGLKSRNRLSINSAARRAIATSITSSPPNCAPPSPRGAQAGRPAPNGRPAPLFAALSPEPGITERAMFGGLAFLVDGSMAVAVSGQGGLMVRCDPAQAEELLAADGVQRMVMRGREMDGWLRVTADAVDEEDALRRWVAIGRDVARSLPAR